MTDERYLTVGQTAERLQVHSDTVIRWIKEGRLDALRLGGARGRFRIAESALDRFLAPREVSAAQQDEAVSLLSSIGLTQEQTDALRELWRTAQDAQAPPLLVDGVPLVRGNRRTWRVGTLDGPHGVYEWQQTPNTETADGTE